MTNSCDDQTNTDRIYQLGWVCWSIFMLQTINSCTNIARHDRLEQKIDQISKQLSSQESSQEKSSKLGKYYEINGKKAYIEINGMPADKYLEQK